MERFVEARGYQATTLQVEFWQSRAEKYGDHIASCITPPDSLVSFIDGTKIRIRDQKGMEATKDHVVKATNACTVKWTKLQRFSIVLYFRCMGLKLFEGMILPFKGTVVWPTLWFHAF